MGEACPLPSGRPQVVGEGTVLTSGTLSEGGDTHLLSGATKLGTDSETCPKESPASWRHQDLS